MVFPFCSSDHNRSLSELASFRSWAALRDHSGFSRENQMRQSTSVERNRFGQCPPSEEITNPSLKMEQFLPKNSLDCSLDRSVQTLTMEEGQEN
jgi:hypothetical protein